MPVGGGILHDCFIHSMCPISVFPCFVNDKRIRAVRPLRPYGAVVARAARSLRTISDSDLSEFKFLPENNNNVAPAPSGALRYVNAHSKAKVQRSSLTCPHCLPHWWGVKGD